MDAKSITLFNICLIVILSVSAFGMALASLLTEKSSLYEVSTQTISGPLDIDPTFCNSYIALKPDTDTMHLTLPNPLVVSGCEFVFQVVQDASTVTFETPAGTFEGISWNDLSLTTVNQISSNKVSMVGLTNHQMTLISDGTAYRFSHPAIGVANG